MKKCFDANSPEKRSGTRSQTTADDACKVLRRSLVMSG